LQVAAQRPPTEIAPRARAMGRSLLEGDIDAFLSQMRWVFSAIPYQLDDATEKRYHGLFHAMAVLSCSPPGMVYSENPIGSGRPDLVLDMPAATWVCEFKRDQPPEAALAQIAARGYASPWEGRGKLVHRVGISYDSAGRTLAGWKVERG